MTHNPVPCKFDFSKRCDTRFDAKLIAKGKLYAVSTAEYRIIIIADMASGEMEQQLTGVPGVRGITFHNNEVFAWTQSEISLIEFQEKRKEDTLRLLIKSSNLDEVRILKRTEKGIVFARETRTGLEVSIVEADTPTCLETVAKTVKGYKLFGTHEDSVFVYFCGDTFYMEMRTKEKFPLRSHGEWRSELHKGVVYAATLSSESIKYSGLNVQT